jgi:hypothetical protein
MARAPHSLDKAAKEGISLSDKYLLLKGRGKILSLHPVVGVYPVWGHSVHDRRYLVLLYPACLTPFARKKP